MIDFEATILSQFANSPTIVQLITNLNAYFDPRANIDQFYADMWNIETAVGYGLDVWGRIVGVSRVLQITSTLWFGFTGPAGVSGLPWNQAPFWDGEPLTSNYSLTDDAFRILILAKALANICNATIPAINQILILLFGANGLIPMVGNSYVSTTGTMAMAYNFPSALDLVASAIVNYSGVLPVPCGVVVTVVT